MPIVEPDGLSQFGQTQIHKIKIILKQVCNPISMWRTARACAYPHKANHAPFIFAARGFLDLVCHIKLSMHMMPGRFKHIRGTGNLSQAG